MASGNDGIKVLPECSLEEIWLPAPLKRRDMILFYSDLDDSFVERRSHNMASQLPPDTDDHLRSLLPNSERIDGSEGSDDIDTSGDDQPLVDENAQSFQVAESIADELAGSNVEDDFGRDFATSRAGSEEMPFVSFRARILRATSYAGLLNDGAEIAEEGLKTSQIVVQGATPSLLRYQETSGYDCSDISRGKEPFPIRVMNEKNKLQLEKFIYIRRNIYLGDAPRSKGAMHCLCAPGSCNITECPCLKGGLAYSVTGTVVPGSCKGNPIYECGPHCPCGKTCSSRVVQKGLRMPFEVFMTARRGWGVRSTRRIQPGEFIMEFVGEIVESDKLLSNDPDNDWAMELTIDNFEGTMYHVDPTTYGNVARFLNHSCDPNLFPIRVYQSGEPADTGVQMAMFSAQVVQKGHELTFHYGDDYWIGQNERGILCACGTSKCKFNKKKRPSA